MTPINYTKDELFKLLNSALQGHKTEYLSYLKDLVACDTRVVGHGIEGGYEKNGQEYLEKLLISLGAQVTKEIISEQAIQRSIKEHQEGNPGHNYMNGDRYNLIAKFKSSISSRSLLFDGHIDTMPFGDISQWKYAPLDMRLENGNLYGRGVSDMKSGLMASIMAVKLIKDAGIDLPINITILSVIDEEGGGNGTLAAMLNGHRADAAVLCEPTDHSINIAHMGFIFFQIDVEGKSLHSGKKWEGINAIEKAYILISALNDLEHQWLMRYKHPFLPSPTLNVGVIEGGTAGSTVPDKCTFKICVHYLPGLMNYSQVVKEINEAIYLRSDGDEWLKVHRPKINIYQSGNAFEQDTSEEIVKTTAIAMKSVFREAPLTGNPSGNDARLLKNIGKMPTIVAGPGTLDQCHTINEHIPEDDYYKFILMYSILILQWYTTNITNNKEIINK